MRPPTPKQLDTLIYIAEYQREHGWSPASREIARHFGITVKGGWDRLLFLEQKGLIDVERNTPRAIRLTDLGREHLMPDTAMDSEGQAYEKILIGGSL